MNTKKKMMRHILPLLRPHRALLACSLLCAMASVTAALLIPVFTGNAIDQMHGAGRVDTGAILRLVLLIAGLAVAAALAQYLMALCNNKITYSVCRDLRDRVHGKFGTLPVGYLDSHSTGDLLSRMVADVDGFADGLLMGFSQLFTGVLTMTAILGIMFSLHPLIALAVLLLTPLSILVARFIASRAHRHFRSMTIARGEETALIHEMIEGQAVITAFGAEERMLDSFDSVNDTLRSAGLKATFFSSLTNPSTRLINNLVYAVIAVTGAIFAVGGDMSVGELSIFLSYAGQYAKPFNEISGVITELQNSFACAGRVFEVLEAPDRVPDPQAPLCPPLCGAVGFSDVSFRYTPERPLIEGLNLSVRPGQRVAIVGPTGCGKTTLINLLMRFYDVDGGAITVDGADIRHMRRADLRARYGMVLQDTWLSNGTVRENIAYANPEAGEEEVVAAARAAYADPFIRRLPEGYNTKITGGGANLSQGQRQLLCIARAMLKLPPMLILDEATSSIDTRTESKIQKAFSVMMQGRTSFIVAHRLSTIREADVILVMKDGQVIEQGSHDELLARNGFYANLYYSQFARP